MKTLLLALAATAWCAPVLAHNPPATAPHGASASAGSALDQAVDGHWRPPAQRARDAARHPRATLAFFQLRPDQTVIEITPSGGWYAQILAPLLREHGHYIAAEPQPRNQESRDDDHALRALFAAQPAQFDRASIVAFDPAHLVFGPPASADRVLTFRNVHNWAMAGTAPAMFKAFFAVLKPGGVLGVVDHRASAGASLAQVESSGYLPVAYVVKLATDAGFVLDGSSEINANPKDDHHHPKGVWTLPPTLALGQQDRARYQAIGESDRMTLRFRKPTVAAAAPAH